MESLQFVIPPLPQFMTIGHSFWQPGMRHYQRNFNVYDILFVKKGKLYISEEGEEFEVGPNEFFVLEANKTHFGHLSCEEITEIYWVHFIHPHPCNLMDTKEISWGSMLHKGTDYDIKPGEQYMYLPKHISLSSRDFSFIIPILQEMIQIHMSFSIHNALNMHSLFAQLMNHMQTLLKSNHLTSRSAIISHKLESYLKKHLETPFSRKEMEAEMRLNFDYMSRCFKKHKGMTLLTYLQYLRVEEAKKLLLENERSIPDIAAAVGVPDYNYFTRIFREKVGMPPGAYRSEKSGFV